MFRNDCSWQTWWWRRHYMRRVKCLYATGNMLISRFRKCSDEVKTKLFKSFFSNAYGSHLWCRYRQSIYKQSVVAYNNIYHKLFGVRRGVSISAICVNNNILLFGVLLRKSIFSFITRLYDSDNNLIKELSCRLFHPVSSNITTKWNQDIYSWQVICRFCHYHPVYVCMYKFYPYASVQFK